MPVPQQRVELLALAKLRNPDEKLLIEEALARLKVGIEAAIKHEQTVTWEKLGFQNEERPETDIRGAGVLGILILLYLAETETMDIKLVLESATRGPSPHEYPFVLTSFQVTCIQIRLLKDNQFKPNPYGTDLTLFKLVSDITQTQQRLYELTKWDTSVTRWPCTTWSFWRRSRPSGTRSSSQSLTFSTRSNKSRKHTVSAS